MKIYNIDQGALQTAVKHALMKPIKKSYISQSDLELLCAFARLQTDDDVADGFPVAAHGILRLTGAQLRHLPLIYLLGLFDTQSWWWATLQSHTSSVPSENSIGPLYSCIN